MAWLVARLFLLDNGCVLRFDEAEAIRTIEALAAGAIDEPTLAAWFRKSLR